MPIPAAFAHAERTRAHAKLRVKAAIEVRYISKAGVEGNVEHTRLLLNQPLADPAYHRGELILLRRLLGAWT